MVGGWLVKTDIGVRFETPAEQYFPIDFVIGILLLTL